jgi:hypothetical protein
MESFGIEFSTEGFTPHLGRKRPPRIRDVALARMITAGTTVESKDEQPQAPQPQPSLPTLDYALAGGGAAKPIANFFSLVEADIVASVLESQGIWAMVLATPVTKAWTGSGGTLMVHETDMERAIEMLASTPARKWLILPEAQRPPAKVLKVETCPQCDSMEVRRPSLTARLALVAAGLCWIPFTFDYGWAIFAGLFAGCLVWLLYSESRRCRDCGHRWREKSESEKRE